MARTRMPTFKELVKRGAVMLPPRRYGSGQCNWYCVDGEHYAVGKIDNDVVSRWQCNCVALGLK